MATEQQNRKKAVQMRFPENALDLIDRAAKYQGTTRTDFLLRAAVRDAKLVLMEQSVYSWDQALQDAFDITLQRAGKANEKAIELLRARKPSE